MSSTASIPDSWEPVKPHRGETLDLQCTPEGCAYTVLIEDETGEFRARVKITNATPKQV